MDHENLQWDRLRGRSAWGGRGVARTVEKPRHSAPTALMII